MDFEKAGFRVTGTSPNGKLVEMVELPNHPFFVGTQAHPEFMSHPLFPHPLYLGFVRAAISSPELAETTQKRKNSLRG